jgi:hypothetical protein
LSYSALSNHSQRSAVNSGYFCLIEKYKFLSKPHKIKQKYPELTAERWEWFDRAEYDKAHPGQGSHDKYASNLYRHMKV